MMAFTSGRRQRPDVMFVRRVDAGRASALARNWHRVEQRLRALRQRRGVTRETLVPMRMPSGY
jgi:hypothetical protein